MRSAITVAISGSACSGKTTLAYLLEHLLPEALVIQQEDFRKDSSSSQTGKGTKNDPIDNVDLTAFEKAIEDCQDTGELPLKSRSDGNSEDVELARKHAIESIPDGARQSLKDRLTTAVGPHRVIIVDGPLLYQDPGLLARANIRLFLRNTKSLAKQRMMTRSAHGHADSGDQEQTEIYFEAVLWPSYVKNSSFLFEKDDVEGVPKQSITELMGVIIQRDIEISVPETLKWAVDAICTVSEEEP